MYAHIRLIIYIPILLAWVGCTPNVEDSTIDVDSSGLQLGDDGIVEKRDAISVPEEDIFCEIPQSGLIKEFLSQVNDIEIVVNLGDGSGNEYRDDTYLFRLAGNLTYLFHNREAAVEVSNEQRDDIVNAIAKTPFHYNSSCMKLAVDGAPRAPSIVLKSDVADYKFTVSDASCAQSDHSLVTNAISCADYQKIMTQIDKVLGGQQTFDCQNHW